MHSIYRTKELDLITNKTLTNTGILCKLYATTRNNKINIWITTLLPPVDTCKSITRKYTSVKTGLEALVMILHTTWQLDMSHYVTFYCNARLVSSNSVVRFFRWMRSERWRAFTLHYSSSTHSVTIKKRKHDKSHTKQHISWFSYLNYFNCTFTVRVCKCYVEWASV